MKKQILIYSLIYGLCGGLLIAALKLIEYRFIVLEHSIEIYGGELRRSLTTKRSQLLQSCEESFGSFFKPRVSKQTLG